MRTLLLLFTIMLLTPSIKSQNLIDTWPLSIKFEKTTMDVGKIKEGTSQSFHFSFAVIGKEAVQLEPYKGGTADINVILPEGILEPGMKAKVTVEFSARRKGNFRKKIELTMKGNKKPKVLELSGTVY